MIDLNGKEKKLICLLVLLIFLIILLFVLKFTYNLNNKTNDLRDVIVNNGYELVSSIKKNKFDKYATDTYYNDKNMVTCIVIYIEDYDAAKDKLNELIKENDKSGFVSEKEEKNNYVKLSTYGKNGYFKITLIVDSYEINVFTPKYQDKVEELVNKIIEYYNN